jgi:hypothetical protein
LGKSLETSEMIPSAAKNRRQFGKTNKNQIVKSEPIEIRKRASGRASKRVNQNEFQDWEIRSNIMPSCFRGRILWAGVSMGNAFLGWTSFSIHHSVG